MQPAPFSRGPTHDNDQNDGAYRQKSAQARGRGGPGTGDFIAGGITSPIRTWNDKIGDSAHEVPRSIYRRGPYSLPHGAQEILLACVSGQWPMISTSQSSGLVV